MKTKKKIALGTLMACLLTGNTAFAAYYHTYNDSSSKDVSITGEYGFGIWANGAEINFTGSNINIDTATGDYNYNVGVYAANNDNPTVVNLGLKDATKLISINLDDSVGNGQAIGIWAVGKKDKKGGIVNVNGSDLKITGHSVGDIRAIYAGNYTTSATSDLATINIDTDNTYINLTSDTQEAKGLVAMSQGIINVNSNLEVHADSAILARGDAQVNVNTDGVRSTKLYGDIEFNYDGPTSGTAINADVNVNLSGTDSVWEGNSKIAYRMNDGTTGVGNVEMQEDGSFKADGDDKMVVNEFALTISDGAEWKTDGDSFVNNLNLDDGKVTMLGDGQEVLVSDIDGTGTIVTDNLDNKMTIGSVEDNTNISVEGTANVTDALAASDYDEALLEKLANTVTSDGVAVADKVTSAEGTVAGVVVVEKTEDGYTYKESTNTSNAGISDMASLALVAWRAENNDMNKRLGELRDSNGEHGVWVRMMRGESEYSSVKNQYNTYQLGYDEKLSTDPSWTVGVAVSYTEGDSSFDKGGGENKHRGISLYGSKLNEDGSFVDLIAKYAQLDHEYTVAGGVGDCDYDANGYSVSAEYGKRFTQDNGFWFEPQVELTYGTVGSANYTAETGALVQQDDMDSLVGRVGFRLGKDIKQGNVYARASYLYDFDGETNVSFTDGVTRSIEQDLGGGWFEVGVGTNINLSKATYLYADVERTFGGEVDTPWQYNVGVRYSF